MNLLIIRHAIAEDKDVWAKTGKDDDERPLTADGKRKMARNARGLRTIVNSIDVLAASPLVRARETAAIVAAEYDLSDVANTASLVPGAPLEDFAAWVAPHATLQVVAVVGHEPHLSTLATWLVSGVEASRIELKKGAACLISFDGAPASGGGTLRWSLTPSQLRGLADGAS